MTRATHSCYSMLQSKFVKPSLLHHTQPPGRLTFTYNFILLISFTFTHRKPESKDGARLLCLADFHVGSDLDTLVPHPMYALAPEVQAGDANKQPGKDNVAPGFRGANIASSSFKPKTEFGARYSKAVTSKICAVSGTIDGALGIFLPVEEKLYRRLALLQQLLSTTVETCCLLNPQEFRLFRSRRVRPERKKGMLDGALLWQFVNLDAALQDDLSAAMGITTDLLLENLQEIDHVTGFF